MMNHLHEGILLLDKPEGISSFFLVKVLRKITSVKKIGHAGTLDPFATGLMIMLVGKNYTKKSDEFLNQEKEYETTLFLGAATDSFDKTGIVTHTSSYIPSLEEITLAIDHFQGECEQTPPMFSAKKVNGKKLYELARQGIEIERKKQSVFLITTFISYEYPYLKLHIRCSKGTYIRSIGHDLGIKLNTYAHLTDLRRTKSGIYSIQESFSIAELKSNQFVYQQDK
ncbi:MAG: tRNA pseudouridine(55) synthase TruB [Chlamydiales bacterium]|nr:tRNA pseudouridine(55) synthase TruB [Chlamydiales bacterium]